VNYCFSLFAYQNPWDYIPRIQTQLFLKMADFCQTIRQKSQKHPPGTDVMIF
jgi:hypothetical protein